MTSARARVVALAREWIGTPYRHDARIKGVAADCTFFAVVYAEAGLIPPVEIAPYSPQAHLHRESRIYIDTVRRYAVEVATPRPGDVVMYFIGRDFSHGGVVVDWPTIIHGDIEAGAIVLAPGDQGRLAHARDRKFFSFTGD